MEKNEQVHLDRSIDLFSALALVIGTVIGSGSSLNKLLF